MNLGVSFFVDDMLLLFRNFQNFSVFDIHKFCIFHSNVSKYVFLYLTSSALDGGHSTKAIHFSLITRNLSILFLQIFPSLLWDSLYRCWAHLPPSICVYLSYTVSPPRVSSLCASLLDMSCSSTWPYSDLVLAMFILLLIPSLSTTVLLKLNIYTLFFSVIPYLVTILTWTSWAFSSSGQYCWFLAFPL